MGVDFVISLLNDTELSDKEKFRIMDEKLVDFCIHGHVLNCYRVLNRVRQELSDLLEDVVNIGKCKIIRKLMGLVDVELDIVRRKMDHPELTEDTANGDNNILRSLKRLHWTAAPTGLAEIIYLIIKCVNNGSADVIEIVKWFEYIFQIKLDNIYTLISQVAKRKKDRTKFLDELKLHYIKFLDSIMIRKPRR